MQSNAPMYRTETEAADMFDFDRINHAVQCYRGDTATEAFRRLGEEFHAANDRVNNPDEAKLGKVCTPVTAGDKANIAYIQEHFYQLAGHQAPVNPTVAETLRAALHHVAWYMRNENRRVATHYEREYGITINITCGHGNVLARVHKRSETRFDGYLETSGIGEDRKLRRFRTEKGAFTYIVCLLGLDMRYENLEANAAGRLIQDL